MGWDTSKKVEVKAVMIMKCLYWLMRCACKAGSTVWKALSRLRDFCGLTEGEAKATVFAEEAYGLYIHIDAESEQVMRDTLMQPAHKTVEVSVKWRDEVREFTFAEFFERLGFYDDKVL